MIFVSPAGFFNINFYKKIFQEHCQSVKQFGSRSVQTLCLAWYGSKLFAKITSRQQNKELNSFYILQLFTETQFVLLLAWWIIPGLKSVQYFENSLLYAWPIHLWI